jgi:S1-C subfamily serine protease
MGILLLASLLTNPTIASTNAALASAPLTVVRFKAALVAQDLSVKPVPRQHFQVVRDIQATGEATPGAAVPGAAGQGSAPLEVVTSLAGEAEASLSPGRYRVRSVAPLRLADAVLSWDVPFEVVAGQALTVELSNDNAKQEAIGPAAAAPPAEDPTRRSTAATIFRAARDSVFTLETETGHGTAFLVDAKGLLLTNQHVVAGSRYFTAAFDDEHRLEAKLLIADSNEDVAVLAVNLEQLTGLPVATLADDSEEHPAAQEGDDVYAIGSPLHQQKIITAGIISKIEAGAWITDVMIDHGNSGGPMFDTKRRVIGINTFGEGRGVSGTIRIYKARQVLEQARVKLGETTNAMPSAAFRPAFPKAHYPAEEMKRMVLLQDFDLEKYHVDGNRFNVYVLTPPAQCYADHQTEIVAAKGRKKRRKDSAAQDTYDPTADIKDWAQYVGEYRAVVQIVVEPKIKATAGSALASGFAGSRVLHYRYQGDVDTLRLRLNALQVTPIAIGREPIGGKMQGPGGHMEDVAYLGYAEFTPDTFDPVAGKNGGLVVEIVDESRNGEVTKVTIPQDLVQRVWNDFAPMRKTPGP